MITKLLRSIIELIKERDKKEKEGIEANKELRDSYKRFDEALDEFVHRMHDNHHGQYRK